MNVKAKAKFMELYGPISGTGANGTPYDYYRATYWIDNAACSFSVNNVADNQVFLQYLKTIKWGTEVDVYLRISKSKKTGNWYVNLDPRT